MEKGTYKKIVLGLLGIFLVFGSLIAPLSNKNIALAQNNDCKVTDAIIVPANYDPGSDQEWGESFFKDGQPAPDVSVEADFQNCKDESVYIEIYELINSQRHDFIKDGTLYSGTDWKNFPVKISQDNSGKSHLTFNLNAGDESCTEDTRSDCNTRFKIRLADGSLLYDSTGDRIGGALDFETNDNGKSDPWIYGSATESSSQTVQRVWYWQNIQGTWFNSQKTTKEDCEADRDKATSANKKEPCTQTPDLSKIADGSQAGQPVITDSCDILGGLTGIAWCFVRLVELIVNFVLGGLVGIAGTFFDIVFSISISSASYGGGGANVQFLKDGWTLLRDFVNLGLIFTLLFVSIQQIMSTASDVIKKTLPKVILVGLLVNFSFFFGTVIVDATNVLARLFYSNDTVCVKVDGKCEGTISEALASKLKPQNIIDQSSVELQKMGEEKVSPGLYLLIIAVSGFCLWKIFKVFFKVGMLFLGRIVQIWVHLVVAPIAFLNEALPPKMKIKALGTGILPWASKLFENAFIAPMFMFFLYLIFLAFSGLEFALDFAQSENTFAAFIGLILPVIALTMILDVAADYTKSHAGKIAEQFAGIVTNAVGAIAGGSLALGGLAFGGAIVKGGGKLLGGAGQKLVAREGKGGSGIFGGVTRWGNSKLANIGGRLNDYSKKLPDKKFDPRNSKWGKAVAGTTGFDMNSYSGETNKALGYLGLKPGESYNDRKKRLAQLEKDDVKRRFIDTKTNKMESELGAEYESRLKKMKDELLNNDYLSGKLGKEYDAAKTKAQAEGKEAPDYEKWKTEYLEKNYADEAKKYKEKVSKSVGFFDAKNAKEYEKAAKEFNEKIQSNFDDKKTRDVYGGKNKEETDANKNANRQSGFGIANPGDAAFAAGDAGLAGFAATVAGGAATGGAVLAGAALYGAGANYKRAGDLEYLRQREKELRDQGKKSKKEEKIKKQIEEEERMALTQEGKIFKLQNSIDNLVDQLANNTKTVKDSTGQSTKSFKETMEEVLKEQRKENEKRGNDEKWSDERIKTFSFNEAYKNFSTELNNTIRNVRSSGGNTTEHESLMNEVDDIQENYSRKAEDLQKARRSAQASKDRVEKMQESMKDKEEDKKKGDGEKKDSKGDDKKDTGGDKK